MSKTLNLEIRIEELLKKFAGNRIEDQWTATWEFETTHGPLRVLPLDGWIACQFREFKDVGGLPRGDFNRFSHKWNIHYYQPGKRPGFAVNADPDACVHELVRRLDIIGTKATKNKVVTKP